MSTSTGLSLRHVRVDSSRVARLVLKRPPLNVMNLEMLAEMRRGLEEAARAEPAVLVLAAEGRAFSAGVDVADHTEDKVARMLETFHGIFRILERTQAPIVALVKGAALGGGCELVMACDLVLAARSATFGQPEIQLGAFPPVAALLLPHLIGERRASELLLTGEPLSAEEAAGAGLINRVFPDEEFDAQAEEFLVRLARHSRAVLALTKAAIRLGRGRPFSEALPEVESLYLNKLMKTHDAREGIAAFMEKRPPDYKDV